MCAIGYFIPWSLSYKVSELVFVKMKGLNKVGNIGESRSGNSSVEYRTRPLGKRTPTFDCPPFSAKANSTTLYSALFALTFMSLNLASILDDSAEQYPNRVALVSDDRLYTYRDLDIWSKKIAETLSAFGIRRGDHVAIMIPNVPEFTAAYFGILKLGGVVIPINTMLLENEVGYLLNHSDAKCLLAWSAFSERCFKAFQSVDHCEHLILLGEHAETEYQKLLPCFAPNDSHRTNTLSVLAPLLKDKPGQFDTAQTGSDDTAVILYTSGTTGRPKGAELSHFNMFSNAFYTAHHCIIYTNLDVGLGILPLFHSFGQTVIQNAFIIAGAKVVLVPQFEPKKALQQIEQHKISFIAAVPTMFHLLLQHQKRNPLDVSSVRLTISGGAPLPLALADEFQKVFGTVLAEGYGLSETSPITNYSLMGNREPKPGSIGPQIVGTQVRIMRDDGTFAEPGEVGELVIRGHNLMKGYYKDRLATQAVMQGGWFRTGDVGRVDADGFFYIVDRKKDVIIRAGMNIYPRDIEEVLLRHPAVKEVSVIGVQDETLSENVVAFVVLVDGESPAPEALLKYCREHLALFKCPKTVHFLDALPKGPTGKILKRELRRN